MHDLTLGAEADGDQDLQDLEEEVQRLASLSQENSDQVLQESAESMKSERTQVWDMQDLVRFFRKHYSASTSEDTVKESSGHTGGKYSASGKEVDRATVSN